MPNERGHGYACGCYAKGRRRGTLDVHRRGSAWFRRFAVFGFCTVVLPIVRYDTLDCAVVAIGNANGLKSGTVEVFSQPLDGVRSSNQLLYICLDEIHIQELVRSFVFKNPERKNSVPSNFAIYCAMYSNLITWQS